MIELDDAGEIAYELVLRHPGLTPDLLHRWWARPEGLAAVLERLVRQGYLRWSPEGGLVALPPEHALSMIVAPELVRLERAEAAATRLVAAAQAPPAGSPLVVAIADPVELAARMGDLRAAARAEVCCLGLPPDRGPEDRDWGPEQELAGRGVRVRVIGEPAADVVPAAGFVIRRPPEVPPSRLYLVDAETAVIAADLGEPRAPAGWIVHSGVLLESFTALFESCWEDAVEVDPDRLEVLAPGRGDDAVLTWMLSGLTDAAIARRLGVSTRTAQRRIAELMAALGARSRFQAGVHVALRGRARHAD